MQKLGKGTQATFDDRLFKNIIDGTASTLVKTSIQGGNLRANLEDALKSGLATVIQGGATNHIKGVQDVNWMLHKRHAAAGYIAGIQKDCEARAIGVAVGAIVAEQLSKPYYQNIDGDAVLILTDDQRNSIIKQSQLATPVIAAYSGYDAQIAANTAETSIEDNGFWAAIPAFAVLLTPGIRPMPMPKPKTKPSTTKASAPTGIHHGNLERFSKASSKRRSGDSLMFLFSISYSTVILFTNQPIVISNAG